MKTEDEQAREEAETGTKDLQILRQDVEAKTKEVQLYTADV